MGARGMKRFFCLAALCLLPVAAHAAPDKIVLPSAFSGGFAYIKVSINGAPAVWMNIDDGTTPSAIDIDYARSLGLTLKHTGKLGEGAGDSPAEVLRTRAATLATGSVSQANIAFEATSLKAFKAPDGTPLEGILGYSFLKGRILVLDYKAGEVDLLTASKPAPGDLPFTYDDDVPSIAITVAGHPVTALIDSGGGYNLLLTPATATAIGLGDAMASGPTGTGYGYNGAQTMRGGTAPDLNVGTITLTNPATVFTTFGNAPLKAGGSLGNQFLMHYRVTLNYRTKTIRFEP